MSPSIYIKSVHLSLRLRRRLTEVIEGIENDVKLLKPLEVVLGFLNVAVYWRNLDIGVERRGSLCGNLSGD
jgi:hypothetical protein